MSQAAGTAGLAERGLLLEPPPDAAELHPQIIHLGKEVSDRTREPGAGPPVVELVIRREQALGCPLRQCRRVWVAEI